MKSHILLINGPNIREMESREPSRYECFNMDSLIKDLKIIASKSNFKLSYFQSNAEHSIIDKMYHLKNEIDFIICNPASLAHTSISLRDAFLSTNIPFIEVHMSNIYARESFRHKSYLSDISMGVICGFGKNAYYLALTATCKILLEDDQNLYI